jgi:hypothetical protein
MSDPISLKQQVAFMKKTLETCETSYPIRIEMGRMTKQEAERGLAKMRAVLETLQKVEIAGGVAESAMKEMAPAAKDRNDMTRASVMTEVHRCAREHAYACEHCASIANILDEVGSKV